MATIQKIGPKSKQAKKAELSREIKEHFCFCYLNKEDQRLASSWKAPTKSLTRIKQQLGQMEKDPSIVTKEMMLRILSRG